MSTTSAAQYMSFGTAATSFTVFWAMPFPHHWDPESQRMAVRLWQLAKARGIRLATPDREGKQT